MPLKSRNSIDDAIRDSGSLASIRALRSGGIGPRSASARAVDKLFREAPVPVFLLPTGSNPADFKLAFDFKDMMNELRSGILVRPVITVFIGREDFDETYLTNQLKDEFVRQFNKARDAERESYESDIRAHPPALRR